MAVRVLRLAPERFRIRIERIPKDKMTSVPMEEGSPQNVEDSTVSVVRYPPLNGFDAKKVFKL